MKFSKKIVTSLLVFALAFVIVQHYTFLRTGAEQTALIVAVFGAVFGELGLLALLKKMEEELKHERRNYEGYGRSNDPDRIDYN